MKTTETFATRVGSKLNSITFFAVFMLMAIAGNPALWSQAVFNIYPQVVAPNPVNVGFNMEPAPGTNITENMWLGDGGFSPLDTRFSFTASQTGTATTFVATGSGGTSFWSSITTGYFVGATAYTYRYDANNGTWSLLRTDTVTGYTALDDSSPADNTITFASSGPVTETGDIVWLDMDDQSVIPSIEYLDPRFSDYVPNWSTETLGQNETRSTTWPATLSTNVPSSDTGGLSIEISDSNTETQGIWQYLQGAFVGPADEEFQSGHTYEVSVWLMQSGIGNGSVTFSISALGLSHTFTGVNGSWQLFTWTFSAVPGLPANSVQPSAHLDYSAPGTLWVDNFQLYDTAWSPNTVNPTVMTAWQNYKPGFVRIWSNFGTANQGFGFFSLNSWLTPEIKTRNTPNIGNDYELPGQLEHLPDALANVKTIGNGANPWLIVNMALSPTEWGELIDYLAAPEGTGYASMRPSNHPGPYTADFGTIYLEVGNEEWGTQSVPADAAYGPWANFVISQAIAGKSYYSSSQIKFVLNGFPLLPGFGSSAISAAPQASVVDFFLYTTGEKTAGNSNTFAGDQYYQSDLVQLPMTDGPWINAVVAQQQLDALAGHNYTVASYEEGPDIESSGGGSLGDDSLAGAIGAIDTNLYATQNGFGAQNFFLYSLGTQPFASHTNFANGFIPHPVWEAYEMRNNYCTGPMVLTTANSNNPTYSDPNITLGQAVPVIAVYTFADANVANQADVVVLSRSLSNSTQVTLNFPAIPTGNAQLYTLTGNPEQTNDDGLNIPIGSQQVSVTQSYTFSMPPGSMYLFQVPMNGAWSSSGEPIPPAPTGLSASPGNGKVTLTWTPSTGAASYNVLRGTVSGGPYTQIANTAEVGYIDSTVTNGTTYYYVVEGVNVSGASGYSSPASATPNVLDTGETSTQPPLTGANTGAWANANFVPITYQIPGAGINGYTPDTAQFKTLWDSNYLYLLVSVQDSTLVAPTQANIWLGDTVEVYFSATDTQNTSYGPTDFQWGLPYGNGGAVLTEEKHGATEGVIFAQENITGGYQMVLALPWATLGTTPVVGQQYGFEITVDDATSQGTQVGRLAWWQTTGSLWENPSLMGPLVLASNETQQTITFTPPTSPVTYPVSPITLQATASSGLTVTFSVLSGPGTVSGNTLTVTGPGTIVVAANQAGNSTYAAAPQVTQSVVVNSGSGESQTISFTPPTSPVAYGVSPITLSATATSGLAVNFSVLSGPGSVSGSTLTVTGVGTIVVAANQPGNGTYAAAPQVTQNVVVTQATQSINFTAPTSPVTYPVSPITLQATATSGLTVTFSIVSGPGTVSGNTLTVTGTGTIVVAANQAGNADYAAASQVTQSVVVNSGSGGSLLAYEPFGETSGSTIALNNASGGGDSGWAEAWTVQNGDTEIPGYNIVDTTPLTYSGLQTTGNYAIGGYNYVSSGRQLNVNSGGPFNSYLSGGLIGASGQTLWLSFLMRIDDLNNQTGAVILTSNSGSNAWLSSSTGDIGIGYLIGYGGSNYWGLMYNNGTPVLSTVPVTQGQTALLVAEITFGSTNTINLFVNPTSLGGSAPSTPSATISTTGNIGFESLAYYGGNGNNESSIGDIRFGSSYAAVTPTSSGGESQTITFTPPTSPVTYGVSPITLSATATSGLAVTFSVVSGPGTVSGNTLTVTGAGTIVVAANQAGNGTYAAAPQVTQNVVVNQESQSITFTAPSSPVTYGVSPISLSATATSGLTVTFSVVSGPGTVSGSTLTVTGVGTIVVAANQAGNTNYSAASQVTQSVVVNQASQTITFTQPTTPVTYGVSPISLSATASSGLAVTFSVSSGPGTISGSTLTVTGVGTIVVAANQAGNADYTAATQVTKSVVVNQASQTITFTPPTSPVNYPVSPITLSATATSGLTVTFSVVSGPGTVSGATLTVTGVGTIVVAANQAGNSDYAAATQVTQSVVVNGEAQTITFTQPTSPVTYGVSPITLSATASSGLTVTFSIVSGPGTISGATLTVTGAGTIVVAANQAGNSTYAAAPQVTRNVVVNQESQTITFTQPTTPVTYGVSPISLSATATSGLTVTFSVSSGPGAISGATLTVTGAGTIVVAANQAGNTNYSAATQVTRSVVVNQASQTITFTQPTTPVTYGVSPISLSATASSGLTVTFTVSSGPGTISGSTLTVTGVGTIVVAANQAGNTNYTAATQVTKNVVVTQATQSINFTAPTSPITYPASPITLQATATSGLTVTFSVVSGPGTVSGATLTVTGTGTIVVAANQAGNADYAAATQVTQSIVVNAGGGGTLLAYEPFGETSGSTIALNGASGGGDSGWGAAWVVQNGDTEIPGYNIVDTTPLTYSGLTTTGNYAIGGYNYVSAGRQLNVNSGGPFNSYLSSGLIGASGQTLWLSFLMRVDNNNGQTNAIILNSNSSGNSWL
ncbi:MAG: sugar-binding protein, partial [Terracidiphilus sp.]